MASQAPAPAAGGAQQQAPINWYQSPDRYVLTRDESILILRDDLVDIELVRGEAKNMGLDTHGLVDNRFLVERLVGLGGNARVYQGES